MGHLDSQGVEGLPLRLMLVAVVMAITLPLMFGALRAYDRSRVQQELESSIASLAQGIKALYTAGPGNSRILEVTIPSGSFTHVDYVRLGSAPGDALASTVRYRISGQQEVIIVVKDPNVPISSAGNRTLELPPGRYDIRAECMLADGDLNGDGLGPDALVRVVLAG